MPSTPLAILGEWRLLVATPDEILSPELLGLSYHLRARRRLIGSPARAVIRILCRPFRVIERAPIQPPFRAIDRY